MNSEVMMCIKAARNKSQVKAIKAVALKDIGIHLIQGPPGTGKT
jgi:type II secretory ATPase GspE/PulE/Tfp pilus assembly ATPase PilB-like protein